MILKPNLAIYPEPAHLIRKGSLGSRLGFSLVQAFFSPARIQKNQAVFLQSCETKSRTKRRPGYEAPATRDQHTLGARVWLCEITVGIISPLTCSGVNLTQNCNNCAQHLQNEEKQMSLTAISVRS